MAVASAGKRGSGVALSQCQRISSTNSLHSVASPTASPVAREEFPQLDATTRGTVSIELDSRSPDLLESQRLGLAEGRYVTLSVRDSGSAADRPPPVPVAPDSVCKNGSPCTKDCQQCVGVGKFTPHQKHPEVD